MEITILNRQRSHPVDRSSLHDFLVRLSGAMPASQHNTMAICLVSDPRIRELNRRFRQRDRATDVLSFPADGEPAPDGSVHLGDIVISVTTAARQADEAAHSLDRELRCLLLHGYLHLLGYDHETDDGTMMRLERKLVRQLLPTGSVA